MAHSSTSPEYHTVVRKVLLFPRSASPARWYRKPELTCNSGNHLTLVVSHLQRRQGASHHQTQYHHDMLITHHARTYFIQAVRLCYLTTTQVHERLPMTNNSIYCSKAAGMEAMRADAIASTIVGSGTLPACHVRIAASGNISTGQVRSLPDQPGGYRFTISIKPVPAPTSHPVVRRPAAIALTSSNRSINVVSAAGSSAAR